jgi:hypothetical protein
MHDKTLFSGLQRYNLSEIQAATQSIKIAVAWFTDADVFNLIINKRREGISVMLVLSKDDTNFNRAYSLDLDKFTSSGCILSTKTK